MKLLDFIYPKVPTWKDVLLSLIQLPKAFSEILKKHFFVLLPLVLTQLLQRSQDVLDSRFISSLGSEALAIHNVQFNLYFIGQEIGLAAAISALIFWRRKESIGKQGFIFKLHLIMPLTLSFLVASVFYLFLGTLEKHFSIPPAFSRTAHVYWSLGLINLILRSIQIPLSAILIACDQRLKCLYLNGGTLLGKFFLGWLATNYLWNTKLDPSSILTPMLVIDVGAIAVLIIGSIFAIRWISSYVDGWDNLEMRLIFKVWNGELGIAAVNSIAAIIFGFQIAKVATSPGFFVTYQLAISFTYILALPVIAGMQIAVRDASAEHSNTVGMSFVPLHQSKWWPQFFYASLIPTCFMLGLTAVFSKSIFLYVYNYKIPAEHQVFMPVFFSSWILWECGDVFLIMLRAAKKNGLATRNYLIATVGIELLLTQVLLWKGWATPVTLSAVMVLFCSTYLLLNRNAISNIQSKFFFRKLKISKADFSKIKLAGLRIYRNNRPENPLTKI